MRKIIGYKITASTEGYSSFNLSMVYLPWECDFEISDKCEDSVQSCQYSDFESAKSDFDSIDQSSFKTYSGSAVFKIEMVKETYDDETEEMDLDIILTRKLDVTKI